MVDYTGLCPRYSNDRLLSAEERRLQLKQKVRLDVPPLPQLAVIRMNARYLELVDRWFAQRGFAVMIGLVVMILSGTVVWLMLHGMASGAIRPFGSLWAVASGAAFAFALLFLLGLWIARLEAFAWTHYPIRLDRVNRMVHVFRTDGTIMSAPWDRLFFTLGRSLTAGGTGTWDVRGLLLDADGQTVRETFAFAAVSSQEIVRGHWEFLRRYMEDGPEAVHALVGPCMPVAERREGPGTGMERIFADDANGPAMFYLLSIPFNLVHGLARWIAMRTSRIPTWPAGIEATMPVAADDPFRRDAGNDPAELPDHRQHGRTAKTRSKERR